jgi:hypothetical protein
MATSSGNHGRYSPLPLGTASSYGERFGNSWSALAEE